MAKMFFLAAMLHLISTYLTYLCAIYKSQEMGRLGYFGKEDDPATDGLWCPTELSVATPDVSPIQKPSTTFSKTGNTYSITKTWQMLTRYHFVFRDYWETAPCVRKSGISCFEPKINNRQLLGWLCKFTWGNFGKFATNGGHENPSSNRNRHFSRDGCIFIRLIFLRFPYIVALHFSLTES